MSLDELSERVGSTKPPVRNRVKNLKQRSVIRQEVAVCGPEALGLNACFFLVQTSERDATWQQQFLDVMRERPDVMEKHRPAGEVEYLLKVHVADAKAQDNFYRGLIVEVKIFKMTALLSMEEVKHSIELALSKVRKRRRHRDENGAGNEVRTRDLNLGKVALYQLSYSRIVVILDPRWSGSTVE